MKIYFFSTDNKIYLKNDKKVKLLLQQIFNVEKKSLQNLNIIFCSDTDLLNINAKYLKHDYLTDVITFDLSQENEPLIGEIYISVDRIKENAKVYGITYQRELLRVIIHGVLHLCGFGDNTKSKKNLIHAKEDHYLNLYKNSRET